MVGYCGTARRTCCSAAAPPADARAASADDSARAASTCTGALPQRPAAASSAAATPARRPPSSAGSASRSSRSSARTCNTIAIPLSTAPKACSSPHQCTACGPGLALRTCASSDLGRRHRRQARARPPPGRGRAPRPAATAPRPAAAAARGARLLRRRRRAGQRLHDEVGAGVRRQTGELPAQEALLQFLQQLCGRDRCNHLRRPVFSPSTRHTHRRPGPHTIYLTLRCTDQTPLDSRCGRSRAPARRAGAPPSGGCWCGPASGPAAARGPAPSGARRAPRWARRRRPCPRRPRARAGSAPPAPPCALRAPASGAKPYQALPSPATAARRQDSPTAAPACSMVPPTSPSASAGRRPQAQAARAAPQPPRQRPPALVQRPSC